MKPKNVMTDEEFDKLHKLIRLVLFRAFAIWIIGILFLYFLGSK